jgi:pimeloyl-ACP methyl ester carboxylesterase
MMRSLWRWAVRVTLAVAAVLAVLLLTEFALEARDYARYTKDQSFANVDGARIRYRYLSADRPGAVVVLLTGIAGSIEQSDEMQSAVARDVPMLTYDRAGYGFSQGSTAHTAEEQAAELAALLQVLKIDKPIVLVGYSASAGVARVFAGRYPEKTAALYLIDPPMAELDRRPELVHNFRRYYVKWVVHDLVASSLGYIRLQQRLHSWRGPDSLIEQRKEAVLARRSHYWALARDWWVSLDSSRQTIEAPVPPNLPIELVFPKRIPDDALSLAMTDYYAKLVARSSRGKLVEMENVDHSQLIISGPDFEQMVGDMKRLSKAAVHIEG